MLELARAADIGPVAVACGDPEIAEAVRAAGGLAVMTDPDLPSGSDRVHAALAQLDPDRAHDVVLNLQATCRPCRRTTCAPPCARRPTTT